MYSDRAVNRYIAIDLGAESGRVMVGEISNAAIQLVEVHRFANTPINVSQAHGPALCWDIHRIWNEINIGLAKIRDQFDPATIASIGVDAWGVDFALLDHAGNLLELPVCYRDPRTGGMMEQIFARLPKEKIYAITGIQTMPINTLFQLASLSLRNAPELRAAKHLVFLPDLITYWLSGTLGTEYTIASTSQLLDARTRQWSPEIFDALGMDTHLFPPIDFPALPSSIRGTLRPAIQKMFSRGVPGDFAIKVIAVAAHDTASAVAAVPAAVDDWLYLSSGTWSLLGAEIPQPILNALAAAHDVTNEGGIGGTIRLLKNIAGLFLLQECRREWLSTAPAGGIGGVESYDYATLTQSATHATPLPTILDMNDPDFASPGNMPGKIIAHCRRTNQPAPATPGEFTRVILQSLAQSYDTVRRMLEAVTGKNFATLHIVGGGGQNNLLNQLAANATGMTVLAGPVEATALGNVLCQALSLGNIRSLREARGLVAHSTQIRRFVPQ